ncbi:hypothetical protein L7F22_021794 [Adiantum nelumboides]|nr:hypothetical protein [Adiantum nelumboides]
MIARAMGLEEDDEDTPRLSSHALAALQEFLSTREPALEENSDGGELSREAEAEETGKVLGIVAEDWHLSQFWYDEHTTRTVDQELFLLSTQLQSPIACISCPSLYVELKKSFEVEAFLLEYDPRFERYGKDFTFYDYNFPENLPSELHHAFQVVVADPPYLSRECLEKTAQTMKLLSKNDQAHFLLLTGAVQQDHAKDLLRVCPCGFRPGHHNKLGNEFLIYTSYDPLDRLGGWTKH